MTPIERKEAIAKANWLREVKEDSRFQEVVEETRQDLDDALKKAEQDLIDCIVKRPVLGRFYVKGHRERVQRLRYGRNILDLILSNLDRAIDNGSVQSDLLRHLQR